MINSLVMAVAIFCGLGLLYCVSAQAYQKALDQALSETGLIDRMIKLRDFIFKKRRFSKWVVLNRRKPFRVRLLSLVLLRPVCQII
jgi:hypothetical protein